jgi:hypothetical protein
MSEKAEKTSINVNFIIITQICDKTETGRRKGRRKMQINPFGSSSRLILRALQATALSESKGNNF